MTSDLCIKLCTCLLSLRLFLQTTAFCCTDINSSCAWHHPGSWMQGTDVRNPTLRRSAMWCWVPASLAWSNHCARCVHFWGRTEYPSVPGMGPLWYQVMFYWMGLQIPFYPRPAWSACGQRAITRNWILTRPGETRLLLPGSLHFAAGKWICWSLLQNSGCSQPFSWKILQFKRKLVCLPISESVWNDRSVFSQAFSLQLLNPQIRAEVEILL